MPNEEESGLTPARMLPKSRPATPQLPSCCPRPDALPETDPDLGLLSSTQICALMPHCRSRLGKGPVLFALFSLNFVPSPVKSCLPCRVVVRLSDDAQEVSSVPQSLDHLSCPAQKNRNHPPTASTKNHVLLSTESIPLLLAKMNFISRK